MTDIPALDAAVNEAARKMGDRLREIVKECDGSTKFLSPEACNLLAAVDARAAADKPQPLTAKEAVNICDGTPPDASIEEDLQAVLDAAAERWVKVLDHETTKLIAPPVAVTRDFALGVRACQDIIRSALKPGGK